MRTSKGSAMIDGDGWVWWPGVLFLRRYCLFGDIQGLDVVYISGLPDGMVMVISGWKLYSRSTKSPVGTRDQP
jgi:hypothetical protein